MSTINYNPWLRIADNHPPNNQTVETKIDDGRGVRNVCTLKKSGNLWFVPDGTMYVYYTPTHWRPLLQPDRFTTTLQP